MKFSLCLVRGCTLLYPSVYCQANAPISESFLHASSASNIQCAYPCRPVRRTARAARELNVSGLWRMREQSLLECQTLPSCCYLLPCVSKYFSRHWGERQKLPGSYRCLLPGSTLWTPVPLATCLRYLRPMSPPVPQSTDRQIIIKRKYCDRKQKISIIFGGIRSRCALS